MSEECRGLSRRKRSAAESVSTGPALSLSHSIVSNTLPPPPLSPSLPLPPSRPLCTYPIPTLSVHSLSLALSVSLSLLRSTLIRRKSLSRRRRPSRPRRRH